MLTPFDYWTRALIAFDDCGSTTRVDGIEFHVQAEPRDGASWATFVRRLESLGFAGLRVADHLGTGPSPFVALSAAAAVSERLWLTPYVLNAGVWDPLVLANEIATLNVVSDGRAVCGLGAGHTPTEWTMRGMPVPTPRQRVDRLTELVATVPRLLAGETVNYLGVHFECRDAVLEYGVSGVVRRIPLLIGGNGKRVLELARSCADIVGLSGLGATLEDGHDHVPLWSAAEIDRSLQRIEAAERQPFVRDVLVQFVAITNDRRSALRAAFDRFDDAMIEDAAQSPYVLVGTLDEIDAQCERQRAQWGITSYTVRGPAVPLLTPLVSGA